MRRNCHQFFITVFFAHFFAISLFTSLESQVFQWAKGIYGSGYYNNGREISTDLSGNVYVAGDFSDTVDFDPGPGSYILTTPGWHYTDPFVCKLDASGNFLWVKQFAGAYYNRGCAIALDGEANVYITGYFGGAMDCDPGPGVYNLVTGNWDAFVIKLSADGDLVWAKKFGGVSYDYGFSIEIDPSTSDIVILGGFYGTIDFDPGAGVYNLTDSIGGGNMFISKLDSSGNFIWAKKLGGYGHYDHPFSLALDASGYIYSTGMINDTVDFDPGPGVVNLIGQSYMGLHMTTSTFISKLDPSGNYVWAKEFLQSEGTAIETDNSGNVVIAGIFSDSVDFDPGPGTYFLYDSVLSRKYVTKLDSGGNFVWAKMIHVWEVTSLAIDAAEDVYFSGNLYGGSTDIDPGPDTFLLTNLGWNYRDPFISKFDKNGDFIWAKKMGGQFEDRSYSIYVDNAGFLYSTGHYSDTADFDPDSSVFNLVCDEWLDGGIYIFKISSVPVNVDPGISEENDIIIFPNPAVDKLSVRFSKESHQISGFEIVDVFGKIIYSECLDSDLERIDVDVSTIATGLYVLRLHSETGSYSVSFIKN